MSAFKLYKLFKYANRFASLCIVMISLYLLSLPLLPEAYFLIQKVNAQGFNKEYLPEENLVVVPTIFIEAKINEGETDETLTKGIWRLPFSSTPDSGGNTVLVAHRFLWTFGPNTFYHLDKLKPGDEVFVKWNQSEYTYEVFDILEVNANATEIEENTAEPILTLYTCTPLWSSEKRLVVKARLLQK